MSQAAGVAGNPLPCDLQDSSGSEVKSGIGIGFPMGCIRSVEHRIQTHD